MNFVGKNAVAYTALANTTLLIVVLFFKHYFSCHFGTIMSAAAVKTYISNDGFLSESFYLNAANMFYHTIKSFYCYI